MQAQRTRLGSLALTALLASLCAAPMAAPLAAQGPAIVAAAHKPDLPPELEKVRAGLERFEDYNTAEQNVYVAIGCVDYGIDSGEGSTYSGRDVEQVMVNYLYAISGELDPNQPAGLVYARTPTGPLRLAAAVWSVPYKPGMERPKLFGQEFTGPVIVDGETPLQHVNLDEYELYVWLWEENPRGVFARTNPNLPCVPDGYSIKAQFHDPN